MSVDKLLGLKKVSLFAQSYNKCYTKYVSECKADVFNFRATLVPLDKKENLDLTL